MIDNHELDEPDEKDEQQRQALYTDFRLESKSIGRETGTISHFLVGFLPKIAIQAPSMTSPNQYQ